MSNNLNFRRNLLASAVFAALDTGAPAPAPETAPAAAPETKTGAAVETRKAGDGKSVVTKTAAAQPGETPVKKTAAKKTAKKAPKAKKVAAKKAPKTKKAPAQPGKTKSGLPTVRLSDESVVTVAASAKNPRREGSVKWKQFELVKKNSGKTVAQHLKAGALRSTLRSMLRRGQAHAKGATA